MYKMLMKFFRFCGEKNRKKFYRSVVLGVLEALCSSMKIAAAYFAIKAVLEGDFSFGAFALVIGLMLISTIGKTIITRFSQMLQTEGGYDTCAMKRIEIAEHLRYLPMGYFNDTSLGHITSVTTNTLEQMADIATRAVMMILQGSLTTVVIATGMLIFDWRIGLIGLCGIAVFLFVNQFTNKSVAKVANEKLAADRDIVGVVLEYIQGISEIRNYHLVEKNNARLDKAIERKTKNDIRAELAAIPAVGVQMLVCKLTGVAICGASLYFYFDGSMAIHNTIIMLLCSYMIFEMLDMAGIYTALLRIIGKGVDLAEEILNIPQMDIDGEEIHPDNLDMHMEHVSFAYENRKIIDDVTLDIKEKTTTAIVGPSGGGKTCQGGSRRCDRGMRTDERRDPCLYRQIRRSHQADGICFDTGSALCHEKTPVANRGASAAEGGGSCPKGRRPDRSAGKCDEPRQCRIDLPKCGGAGHRCSTAHGRVQRSFVPQDPEGQHGNDPADSLGLDRQEHRRMEKERPADAEGQRLSDNCDGSARGRRSDQGPESGKGREGSRDTGCGGRRTSPRND